MVGSLLRLFVRLSVGVSVSSGVALAVSEALRERVVVSKQFLYLFTSQLIA